jgi:hypothetical protein
MKVLVACEFSGTVRDAYARRGHDAWSCDIIPSESPGNHFQCDVLSVLDRGWDLMIAHPPCTHLAISGSRWFPKKIKEQQDAIDFVLALLNAPIKMIALENPVGVIGTVVRPADQIIQPWMFGDEAQKTTCLWLKNLPPLRPTKIVSRGEFIQHSNTTMPKWYDDTWDLPPEQRKKERARTFKGIAEAMASQWCRPTTVGFGLEWKERRRRGRR